jgi:uncharacterized protein YifE (UPF0438 family)
VNTPESHRVFLNQRNFSLQCANIFTHEEHAILTRYGCWLSALVSGAIQPITPAEEKFIAVDRGEVVPETLFEVAWIKLKERRRFDEQQRDAPHYKVF